MLDATRIAFQRSLEMRGLTLKSKTMSLITLFFFNDTATTEIYTLSLHDALPISPALPRSSATTKHRFLPARCASSVASIFPSASHLSLMRTCTASRTRTGAARFRTTSSPAKRRSEEHTSELQSRSDIVCRLLLEK